MLILRLITFFRQNIDIYGEHLQRISSAVQNNIYRKSPNFVLFSHFMLLLFRLFSVEYFDSNFNLFACIQKYNPFIWMFASERVSGRARERQNEIKSVWAFDRRPFIYQLYIFLVNLNFPFYPNIKQARCMLSIYLLLLYC